MVTKFLLNVISVICIYSNFCCNSCRPGGSRGKFVNDNHLKGCSSEKSNNSHESKAISKYENYFDINELEYKHKDYILDGINVVLATDINYFIMTLITIYSVFLVKMMPLKLTFLYLLIRH